VNSDTIKAAEEDGEKPREVVSWKSQHPVNSLHGVDTRDRNIIQISFARKGDGQTHGTGKRLPLSSRTAGIGTAIEGATLRIGTVSPGTWKNRSKLSRSIRGALAQVEQATVILKGS